MKNSYIYNIIIENFTFINPITIIFLKFYKYLNNIFLDIVFHIIYIYNNYLPLLKQVYK
jgi:hypothetical protein